MMKKIDVFYLVFLMLLFAGCQESFVPDDVDQDPEYVIEGFIESSPDAIPAFVIITQSLPFFSELSQDEFNSLFVQNAAVSVNDGEKEVVLTQLCLGDLPDEIKDEVGLQLGLDPDSLNLDFCLYGDLFDELIREQGRSYSLNVNIDGNVISATTTIPEFVPLDSLWFTEIPGEPVDSLARLWCKVNDPASVADFYRYYTGNEGERLIIPFQSVTDDLFFNGQEFEFPLNRAESRNSDFDPETFGYFFTGDTIVVKWCNIDAAHFEFWNTLEYSVNSQGPFATYTRVQGNVEGALGIWGGYACDSYRLIVEKE